MATKLEHPDDCTGEHIPRWMAKNPEYLAVAGLLERREKLYVLMRDLSRQEKITQNFLKRYMTEVLEAWFDLEEKTEMALKASGKHRELAAEAMVKADNAVAATDVVIEMGKILLDTTVG